MTAFRRAEVWSNLAAAGGARLAAIPDLVALEDDRKLSGDDELTLTLPVGSPAYSQLLERRVVRVVYTDDTFEEWRILGIADSHGNGGKTSAVTAASPLVDLAKTLVGRTEADGLVHYDFEGLQLTPTEHLNSLILPALTADGVSYFAVGTIDPTWPIDVVYQWTTPLAALRTIAQTTGAELRVRRNGTTNYLVDLLTQIGSGAAAVDVRLGKNIRAVKRDRSSVEQTKRAFPRGTVEDGFGATMARAVWEVVSVVGSVVRLKDSAGGDGPAQFADQLNGLYLRKTSGTLTQISATAVISTLQTDVTVASATSITAGDLVEIRKNSAGDDLTYLDAPAHQATYGLMAGLIDRPDIPFTRNVVKNPAMRVWTGASSVPPDNWTKLGNPTLTKTTTAGRWRFGGQSCRVQGANDGDGLETAYVTIAPTAAQPFFSGFIPLWIDSASGQVRVELVATDGVTTWVFPDVANQKAWTNQSKQWIELGVGGIDLKALGVTQVKIRVVQDGATATDFYVDAAQIVQWASQLPFIEGSGGTKLWQAANDALLKQASPLVKYDVDLLDLARLYPGVWPADELVLGGTINVKDAGLGIATAVRLMEVRRDLLHDADTQVVLSSRPEDLTDLLNRATPAPRPPLNPEQRPVGPDVLSIAVDVHSDGTVNATIQAAESTGSIKSVGRKTGFPTAADVRARSATNGRNVSAAVIDAATGAAMVLDLGEIAYVSALAYEQVSAGGLEGQLGQGRSRQPLKKTTVTKTLVVPFGELLPASEATKWLVFTTGYVTANVLNATQTLWGSLVLPQGVTITAIRAKVYRNAAGDSAVVNLFRSTSTSATTLATLTAATGGWSTQSASLSDLVGSEEYYIQVDLKGTVSIADGRFAWFEVDYTMPDYSKAY